MLLHAGFADAKLWKIIIYCFSEKLLDLKKNKQFIL